MKKWLKIILTIVGIFILCIVLDIVSIYTRNKPIFAIKDDCDCADQIYYGLFYNTYNCLEYPTPQIKMKWNKFSCKTSNTQNIIIGKITDIKDKYVVINGLSDNNSLKTNEKAEITLENNPIIKGANNLIIGQYIKLYPTSIAEVYPILITTNEIEIISENDANMLIEDNNNFTKIIIDSKEMIISKNEYNSLKNILNTLDYDSKTCDDVNKNTEPHYIVEIDNKIYRYYRSNNTVSNDNKCAELNNDDLVISDRILKFVTSNNEMNQVFNVSMIIKNVSLTKNGAKIIITDNNENHYSYGMKFRLDVMKNGNWEMLKSTGDGVFNDMAYHVDKDNKLELNQNWENIYGELKDGNYRLVKAVCVNDGCIKSQYFAVEFTID